MTAGAEHANRTRGPRNWAHTLRQLEPLLSEPLLSRRCLVLS
jgi:hypothetical protein